MANRIVYKPHDKIGEVIFLKNLPDRFSKGGNLRRVGLFKCNCGNEFSADIDKVKKKHTRSCGCLHKEFLKVLKNKNTQHGMWKSPEFYIWSSMLQRCYNVNATGYKNYGGRGITVCERWKSSFENFFTDMGQRPESLSLDRIDVNGNYSPENCRWATLAQQGENKRNTIYITVDGKTKSLTEWARELGVRKDTLRWRLKKWSLQKTFQK